MLKVSYSDTAAGERWSLCGRLAGPWVDELRDAWRSRDGAPAGSPLLLDLSDVTFIDEAGEDLLRGMRGAGVQLVAAGVENTDLLARLSEKGRRPLRRLLDHLKTPCGSQTYED